MSLYPLTCRMTMQFNLTGPQIIISSYMIMVSLNYSQSINMAHTCYYIFLL